jgi:hypothetical protein
MSWWNKINEKVPFYENIPSRNHRMEITKYEYKEQWDYDHYKEKGD